MVDFLECLAADAARLRELAARDLAAPVPTCPEWTVDDLVRHVAVVYLHKTECMRRNARPEPWPPDLSGEQTLALFDRAYGELAGEFAARSPESPAWTWYEPEQTAGFWLRRIAQETVIHRVDAELALDGKAGTIAVDLAEDGVDEVLERFLAYGSVQWEEDFAGLLDDLTGETVRVATGGREWLVRMTSSGVDLSGRDPSATVSGEPEAVLLWLWRRAGDEVVDIDGDRAQVETLRTLLGGATR